jgi:hypothetical protein
MNGLFGDSAGDGIGVRLFPPLLTSKKENSMGNYTGNDNYGKPKSEYLERIAAMEMVKLIAETESKIWLSGYANNNPRSDYHWHVDACYDELKKRTGDNEAYDKAYKRVLKSL